MLGDFVLKICNLTVNDITNLEVTTDSNFVGHNFLNVFNFVCLKAGNSNEYKLINASSPGGTAAVALAGTALLVLDIPVLPIVAIGSAFIDYKLEVSVTFRNGTRDKFHIFLDHLQSSFQRWEHVSQAHKVDVQGEKRDGRIAITFKNTAKQLENHQAEQLKEKGKRLVSQGKFDEAEARFNEALRRANERDTKNSTQTCLNQLENEKDKKALMMQLEGEQMSDAKDYDRALEKFKAALRFAKGTTFSVILKKIEDTQKMKMSEEDSLDVIRRAERLLSYDRHEEALQELKEALRFARTSETRNVLRRKIDSIVQKKTCEGQCEEIIMEAERSLDNDEYRKALKAFEEAWEFAEDDETMRFIRKKQNEIQQIIKSEKKCHQLNQEAQALLGRHEYGEALKILSPALKVAETTQTQTLLNDNITKIVKIKRNQERSERLNQKAETLLDNHRYEEALKKFAEALSLTQKPETINFITKKQNEVRKIITEGESKCHELNEQAQVLLERHEYDEALKMLRRAHKFGKIARTLNLVTKGITRVKGMKRDQEKSERLNREAETLMNNHQYEQALKKLAEASSLTQKTETIELIKRNSVEAQQAKNERDKASALNHKGERLLSEAFNIEGSPEGTPEEATQKFYTARSAFTEARDLLFNEEYEGNYKLANMKIQGNECYNAGIQLENEAMQLKNEMKSLSDREDVVAKCKEAKEKYEMALGHFKEGMKVYPEKFQMSVQLSEDSVSGVQDMLVELEQNILDFAIECTNVKASDTMEEKIEEDSEILKRNCYNTIVCL